MAPTGSWNMKNVHFVLLVLPMLMSTRSASGRLQWSSWGPKTPCSVTCGEGERKQRRYCQVTRSSNGSFTGRRGECKGEAERVYPCFELACPQETVEHTCNCGCKLRDTKGAISSVLSYQKSAACKWTVAAHNNKRIRLVINRLQLRQGKLVVHTGDKKEVTLTRNLGMESKDEFPMTITSSGNTLNVSLRYYKTVMVGLLDGPIQFEATYQQFEETAHPIVDTTSPTDPHKPSSSSTTGLNLTAMIGIGACAAIIVLASLILLYRYCHNKKSHHNEDIIEEADDNASSASSSNRSRSKGSTPQSKSLSNNLMKQRLLPMKTDLQHPTLDSKDSAYESDVHMQRQFLLHNDVPVMSLPRSLPQSSLVCPPNSNMANVSSMHGMPSQAPTYSYGNWMSRPVQSDMSANSRTLYSPTSMSSGPPGSVPAPMNIHMTQPPLGFMIRQAQLPFPTEVVSSTAYQKNSSEGRSRGPSSMSGDSARRSSFYDDDDDRSRRRQSSLEDEDIRYHGRSSNDGSRYTRQSSFEYQTTSEDYRSSR